MHLFKRFSILLFHFFTNAGFKRLVSLNCLIFICLFFRVGQCDETVSDASSLAFSDEKIPSLIETIQFKDDIEFCNIRIPLENPEVWF